MKSENIKIKHLVIVRLALKWNLKTNKLTWFDWLEDSIKLMDKYLRPSLKNQTNQDFELISLVDETVEYVGETLPNEHILKIKTNEDSLFNKDTCDFLCDYILNKYQNYTHVLITRIDRDDCLHKDFIKLLKTKLKNFDEQFIDTKNVYQLKNGETYVCDKYDSNGMVSPFVSSFEKILKNKIKCLPYRYPHHDINKYVKGVKYNDLIALQVIHNNNILNKLKNNAYLKKINLKDFGI